MVTRGGSMGRESREAVFQVRISRCHLSTPGLSLSRSPLAFIPVCAIPLRFLHLVLAGRPRPRVFPDPHIRPPVSLSSPGTTAILLAPLRTIRAIRTPLDISIRHLLGSGCSPRVRERNLRARGMNPVKRRSFYQYRRRLFLCIDLSIRDTPFHFNLENDLCRNIRKFRKHRRKNVYEI